MAGDSVVSFDTDEALDVARSVAGESLSVVAEMTTAEYRLVYVDDVVAEHFENTETSLEKVADAIHRYEAIDFFEQEAFGDLSPTVNEVRAFTTFTDFANVVRVLTDEEGLYVSVGPETEVTTLVRALEPVVRGVEPPDPAGGPGTAGSE